MTSLPLPPAVRAAPEWRQADDDVYVATVSGEYAGFVGITPDGVEAQTARGEDLGVHRTLDLARAAVAAAVLRAVASPAHPPRQSRTPRRGAAAPIRTTRQKRRTAPRA